MGENLAGYTCRYGNAAGVERRLLPKVHVGFTMTYKKAMFELPTLDDKMDGENFVSEDQVPQVVF